MRTLLLCLIALVAVGAELDYRLVVHHDGTQRQGWWDPDTSILHMANNKREWYHDRSVVARTQRIAAPATEPRPKARVFRAEPVRYVRVLYTENGGGLLGEGWLVTDGFDRFTLHTDAAIPISGRDLLKRYAVEPANSSSVMKPDGLDRAALGMAIQAGRINPTRK